MHAPQTDTTAAPEAGPARHAQRRAWLIAALAASVPILGAGFWFLIHSQRAADDPPNSAMGQPAPGPHRTDTKTIEQAAADLAARLEREPGDANGWMLLGKSYEYLGRSEDAQAAFARASALQGSPPKPATGRTDAAPTSEPPPPADRAARIADLEKRVAADPQDAEAWAALGRSRQAAGEYAKARTAFERATELRPTNAQWLADYADAVAASNGRDVTGEPELILARALAADPNHPKALWLAATAAHQRKDFVRATELWEKLANLLEPGSPDAEIVAANIAEARQSMAAGTAPASNPAPGPAGASIRGTVRVSPELAAAVGEADTIFIFARAIDGPPMPIAVIRKPASAEPIDFVLDDSTAMQPGTRLSDLQKVLVGARISRTGNAMPQPGDLEAAPATVVIGSPAAVRIVIDRRRS